MTPETVSALPRWLVRIGCRFPRTVLLLAAAAVVAGVWVGVHLSFETDVLNLMPRRDPVVADFRRVLEEFGALENLVLAVPVPSEEKLETTLAFVGSLAAEIEQSPLLDHVQSQIEDPVKLADAILHHAVLFLDEDGLATLGTRLSDESLAARAADLRSALDTPHGMVAKELGLRDPLGFLPLLLGQLNRAPATMKVDYSTGHFVAADHSMAVILAKPSGPAQNIDFDTRLLADLNRRISTVRERFAQEEEIAIEDVPEVLIGGGHRIAYEDATLIKKDIAVNSAASLVGVMVLFFIAYRRFATAHYAFFPLAVGLALTFVFTGLALGRLNSATSGFSALLVGLGIDFTIVMYGRYLEGRHAGLDCPTAWDEVARWSGPAVFMGAITTVGTFYAFLATRFTGLVEFGLLTGTGIVFMMLAAFLVLPALVRLFDRGKTPPLMAPWLQLGGVLRWSSRHRRWVLGGTLVLTVGALLVAPHIAFDDDVRNLRAPSNQGVLVQERVAEAFGLSFNAMMVRIEAATETEALDAATRLARGLDELVARRVISSYESVANLVPPLESQQRALAWLREHEELTDPTRVTGVLYSALASQGLNPAAFSEGFGALADAFRPAGPVSLEIWADTPVQQVVDRSVRKTAEGVVTVVNVFAPPGMWRREAPPELETLVSTIAGARLTGVNLVSRALRRMVWQDAAIAGGLGLVLVFLMLWWDFRKPSLAALCLVPVVVAMVWTLAFMHLLGMPLNLLNVFVTTMIIGIGSDYTLHVLHRIREGADVAALAGTARSVVVAALTTIVGFGSLVTTHYPGLVSMGWMASFGALFSALIAVVVIPLIAGWKHE